MVNLDPNLVNQDKIRLQKRKKLILVTLTPVIILILISLFFMRTGIYNIIISLSNSNNNQLAVTFTNFQYTGNLIESYLPYYNNGYFKLLQASSTEELTNAEQDFRESLKHNPPEDKLCSIYGNLSYAIELKADLNFSTKNYSEALILYNRAESLLYENDCVNKNSSAPSKDQVSKNAKNRIETSRRKTVNAANNESSADNNNDKDKTNDNQEITEQDLQNINDLQRDILEQAAGNPRQGHGSNTDKPSFNKYNEPNF